MSAFTMKRLDALDAALLRLKLFKTDYPALYPYDKATFCISCANFYLATDTAPDSQRAEMRAKIKRCRKQVHYSFFELFRQSPRNIVYILGTGFALRPFCWFLKMQRKD